MKKVQVTLTRKVKYFSEIEVNDEQYELIKDLDNDDVEMYDPKTIKTLESGYKTISCDPRYLILEDLDDPIYEVEREETMYNVSIKKL